MPELRIEPATLEDLPLLSEFLADALTESGRNCDEEELGRL